MKNEEKVLIVDFGGQYKELIARRVRECGVLSLIVPHTKSAQEIADMKPIGLIFTGGPQSAYAPDAPRCDPALLSLGVPVLGICYGMQLMCHMLGGEVSPCERSEYGAVKARLGDCGLFDGCDGESAVLMSHTDRVTRAPEGFAVTASTGLCPVAAMQDEGRGLYAVQFHPETERTELGREIIRNFLYRICHAQGGYDMAGYLHEQVEAIRARVGEGSVLLGLSGGVDSSVAAALLSEAVPGRLTCIYIDHGFMRKNETEEIRSAFARRKLKLVCIDAHERFLRRIAGVTDPERKRKLIGEEFVRTFEDAARECGSPEFLAQGTIYPDIVESGANSAVIKSHHNVGGLPEDMGFKGVIEPLSGLFKDEVRQLGLLLGLPRRLVFRQPFPGPGLAIRIIGEVTEGKLAILREADAIVREEIGASRARADQYFAVLTNTRSVGVMGDARTYDYVLALRAVETSDFMTGEFAHLPYALLYRISQRITNEVKGVNRVVYDITGKPPATIEWE